MIDLLILFWAVTAVSLLAWVVADSRPTSAANFARNCDAGHNFDAAERAVGKRRRP